MSAREHAHGTDIPVPERSVMVGLRGLPWWGAVLLAAALTALGVFIDLRRVETLGLVFQVAYFAGCVLAVCWVQRRALFGPMVQPPLLLAVAVPGVVLAAGNVPTSGGLLAKAIVVASPLLSGFPTMAITTAATLLVGIVRLRVQLMPRAGRGGRPRTPEKGVTTRS